MRKFGLRSGYQRIINTEEVEKPGEIEMSHK